MTEIEQLQFGEAHARFYRSVIMLEDAWKWIMQTHFRYIQWRIGASYKRLPPICHASHLWDE